MNMYEQLAVMNTAYAPQQALPKHLATIARIVEQHHRIPIQNLMQESGYSFSTIRNGLYELQRMGKLKLVKTKRQLTMDSLLEWVAPECQ